MCCWQPVIVTASVQQQPPDVMRVLFKWSSNFQISSKENQGKSYDFHKLLLFIYLLLTFGVGVFLVWCLVLVLYWVESSRAKGGTQETACCDLMLANVAACISCCIYLHCEKLCIRVDQT